MPDYFVHSKTLRNTFKAAALGTSLLVGACATNTAFPDSSGKSLTFPLDREMNEQIVMVSTGPEPGSPELETTIFKPSGKGPFPVVVMNHGKDSGDPRAQTRDRFLAFSGEFVKRGYAVVLPMRTGFSKSTGDYTDPGCDMTAHGLIQAKDVASTLRYLETRDWADTKRIIVAGQSYGGLTALAFAAQEFPGVRGIINFAGGLKVNGDTCDWKTSLVAASAQYGSKTTIPSIWFYGANDNFFDPELAARMHDAYVKAGGHAQLVAFGPFKKDAHGLAISWAGVKIWWPQTEKFLQKIGMPTEVTTPIHSPLNPLAVVGQSSRILISDVNAIPFLQEDGRKKYREFLTKSFPRAFALSSTGAWAWAEDGDNPIQTALALCQSKSPTPCRLYAFNNQVLWTAEPVMAEAIEQAAPTTQTNIATGPSGTTSPAPAGQ